MFLEIELYFYFRTSVTIYFQIQKCIVIRFLPLTKLYIKLYRPCLFVI